MFLPHQIPPSAMVCGLTSPKGERWGTPLFPKRKEISLLPTLAPEILSQPRVTWVHYQCLKFYFNGKSLCPCDAGRLGPKTQRGTPTGLAKKVLGFKQDGNQKSQQEVKAEFTENR